VLSKKISPELLKDLRVQAGLSQEKLAEKMGWSRRTMINRETKESKISLDEFERLLKVCAMTEADEERVNNVLELMSRAVDLLFTDRKKEKKT
jgi:transcriptional regulator with XRE-family HTH domain